MAAVTSGTDLDVGTGSGKMTVGQAMDSPFLFEFCCSIVNRE